MRITFVLPSFPLEPVGGFRVVYEYANNFVARGHKVTIVHPAVLPRKPLPKGLLKKARRLARLILNPVLPPKPPKTINWQFIDNRVSMLYVPNLNEKYIPDGDAVIATAGIRRITFTHILQIKERNFTSFNITKFGTDLQIE